MMCRSSTTLLLAVLSGALVFTGCSGKKRFTLKGAVSCQGKPLTSGLVHLHMADNRAAMAMIQPDGSFEATDVFPGEIKVTVEPSPFEAEAKAMSGGRAAPAASDAIPPKYRDASTSGLSFNVEPGTPLNIELSK